MNRISIVFFIPCAIKTESVLKYLLLLSLSLSFLSAGPGQKPIRWKHLRTEQEVRTALIKIIPAKASMNQVSTFLLRERHDFFQSYGDSLIAFISPSEPAGFLISRKWMMRFHFKADTLSLFTIREALTGP